MGPKIELSVEEKTFIISLFEDDKFSCLSNAKKEKCFIDKFSKKISYRSLNRHYVDIGILFLYTSKNLFYVNIFFNSKGKEFKKRF